MNRILDPSGAPDTLVLILPHPLWEDKIGPQDSCLPREQSHVCQVKLQCKAPYTSGLEGAVGRSSRDFHENPMRDRLASSSRQMRQLEDWPCLGQERKGGKELAKVFQYS